MRSNGFRRGTRQLLRKDKRDKGMPTLTKVLQKFRVGDFVDCKIDSSVAKGMPHKYFYGKTGIVFNVNPSSYGVIFYRRVGGKYIERSMHIRSEHLTLSKSLDDMKRKQRIHSQKLEEASKTGVKISTEKRAVQGPRGGFTVSLTNNAPIEVKEKPYVPFF